MPIRKTDLYNGLMFVRVDDQDRLVTPGSGSASGKPAEAAEATEILTRDIAQKIEVVKPETDESTDSTQSTPPKYPWLPDDFIIPKGFTAEDFKGPFTDKEPWFMYNNKRAHIGTGESKK